MKVNRTILFVETDTNVLATYGKLLQREGFRVESAQDGLDALKALSQLRPDLVVLELMLPTFDGAEVLKFIRADPRLKTIPVIIFTDSSATELLQDATLASDTKYLPKSDCTPPDMLQTIQDMLAAAPGGDSTTDTVRADFAPAIKLRMAGRKTSNDDDDEDEAWQSCDDERARGVLERWRQRRSRGSASFAWLTLKRRLQRPSCKFSLRA